MDLYREIVLDHYKHPRNFGNLAKKTITIEDGNVTCGDTIEMDVLMKNGMVEDIAFRGIGCAISISSASMLTEEMKGKSVNEVMALSADHVFKYFGTTLTPSRTKCAVLSLEVLQKALVQGKERLK
ncbi:SUF system NifU family Fe-S cluster assembly protein [Candidatus Gottesmanbacteria bacterium]|nr:SUF system NifU family Fe-S cluster assembly protein [Candidatus Gottesmanbacteria bacterium]